MKLEIKEPCHEDWNKMKIGLISRHCEVCEKGVMDFTKMNRAEIITYILSNPNDQVCGRMNKDQFDFHHEDIPILIETLKRQKTPNPFLILALVCLSLSSCAQDTSNHPPYGEVQGMIEAIDDTIPPKVQVNDTIDNITKIGKVACDPVEELGEIEPVLMGDVATDIPVSGGIGIIHEPVPEGKDERVHQFAEQMPEFKGGLEAMQKFIQDNLKYPKYERNLNIEGNVYVRFVVEKDGSITRPEILRTVEKSKYFDAEVVRIIKSMPKWNPGTVGGKNVPIYMTLPIRFSLK